MTVAKLKHLLSTFNEQSKINIGVVDDEGVIELEITHMTTSYNINTGESTIILANAEMEGD